MTDGALIFLGLLCVALSISCSGFMVFAGLISIRNESRKNSGKDLNDGNSEKA